MDRGAALDVAHRTRMTTERIRVGVQVSAAAAFTGSVSSAAAARVVDEAMAVGEGNDSGGDDGGGDGSDDEARNNVDPEAAGEGETSGRQAQAKAGDRGEQQQ